jgi:GNAT superfamily N-acetyltransferase
MTMDAETLYQVIEHTWPAAARDGVGPFTIRDGQGGGKRVSAATADARVEDSDIPAAEAAMRDLGQTPLFMIRDGDTHLDSLLAHRGYEIVDPVTMYACPVDQLMGERPPRTAAIPVTEPMVIMREMWEAGGIGEARLNVMARASQPKTYFVSRWKDSPAGVSFLGMHKGIGMIHALEILPSMRREGLGRWLMHRAAYWIHDNGGHTIAVICTDANKGANGLYSSLGMQIVGRYHYRIHP